MDCSSKSAIHFANGFAGPLRLDRRVGDCEVPGLASSELSPSPFKLLGVQRVILR